MLKSVLKLPLQATCDRTQGQSEIMSLLPYELECGSEFAIILNERLPVIADDNDIRNLSEIDKTVFLIMYFDCQVLNGGIEQWFRNPTGAFTHETLAALDRVGADVTAGIVRELHTMFSGTDISQDYEERNSQFDVLSDKSKNRLQELSDLYCESRESGQIFAKTCMFVDKHNAGKGVKDRPIIEIQRHRKQ